MCGQGHGVGPDCLVSNNSASTRMAWHGREGWRFFLHSDQALSTQPAWFVPCFYSVEKDLEQSRVVLPAHMSPFPKH